MTPEPKSKTSPTPATSDVASAAKTTGARVGEWMTKRVDKALEVAERGVHAAHRLADVAERAIDVTERVLHTAGHPAASRPENVVDADPAPPTSSGAPPMGTNDPAR